jgi:hypothetical protein
MKRSRERTGAVQLYEIRVRGPLGSDWSDWFDGFSFQQEDGGVTILRGPVADQSELYGVVARLRDLNVTLLSIRADPSSLP